MYISQNPRIAKMIVCRATYIEVLLDITTDGDMILHFCVSFTN